MKKQISMKDKQINELQAQMQAIKTEQHEAREILIPETLQTELTNHVLKLHSPNSAHFVKEVISVIKKRNELRTY